MFSLFCKCRVRVPSRLIGCKDHLFLWNPPPKEKWHLHAFYNFSMSSGVFGACFLPNWNRKNSTVASRTGARSASTALSAAAVRFAAASSLSFFAAAAVASASSGLGEKVLALFRIRVSNKRNRCCFAYHSQLQRRSPCSACGIRRRRHRAMVCHPRPPRPRHCWPGLRRGLCQHAVRAS